MRFRPRAWFSHTLGVAALATGCAAWLPAPTPMHTSSTMAHPGQPARCLLVFLPGLGDSDGDFEDHGFIAALRQRNLSVDTISANATLGYYTKHTLLDRLEAEVFANARKAGYQEIWVAGISLGGMGSLLVARKYAKELSGVILIAPYLGDDDVIDEIERSGGVARWQAGPPGDDRREVWRWLQQQVAQPDATPRLYLAHGDRDKLVRGHYVLGNLLPRERVFRTHGKHDWGPWSVLWADFLDHSDFAAHCGVTP